MSINWDNYAFIYLPLAYPHLFLALQYVCHWEQGMNQENKHYVLIFLDFLVIETKGQYYKTF